MDGDLSSGDQPRRSQERLRKMTIAIISEHFPFFIPVFFKLSRDTEQFQRI